MLEHTKVAMLDERLLRTPVIWLILGILTVKYLVWNNYELKLSSFLIIMYDMILMQLFCFVKIINIVKMDLYLNSRMKELEKIEGYKY